MRGVFVTGTGTEVGKTVVSAWIANALRARGEKVAVYKPVVTGLEEPGETDPQILKRSSGTDRPLERVTSYSYDPPVSPHLGAMMAGEPVERERLLADADEAAGQADVLICEGVGGLLVPLGDEYLIRDFASDLALPLVVAASPGLGTLNHTLLTVEAARFAALPVSAVVLTPWPDAPGEIERSNLETIARLGAVPVETLPRIDMAETGSWPDIPESLSEAAEAGARTARFRSSDA